MKSALVSLFVAAVLVCAKGKADGLPSLQLDTSHITVSGISAGGAMAQQFGVAFSKNVSGVGAIAGPPYYCSAGALTTAMISCMYNTMPVGLDQMWSTVSSASSNGEIDDASHLAHQNIWLYTGTQDTVVKSQVVKDGATFYKRYTQNVELVDDVSSEHAWVTSNYGSTCGYLGTPFINNCDYDAAGKILEYTLNKTLASPVSNAESAGSIVSFSQDEYVSGGASSISFASTGYAYVPNACSSSSSATCQLHISFHGCQQDTADIGELYVKEAHLNEWAASNNVVVLYPQVQKSMLFPSNPEACFDWWGYTDANFAYKNGVQMAAVWKMVQALSK